MPLSDVFEPLGRKVLTFIPLAEKLPEEKGVASDWAPSRSYIVRVLVLVAVVAAIGLMVGRKLSLTRVFWCVVLH